MAQATGRWLTVAEAAQLIGRSETAIRRDIQATGCLNGVRVARIGPAQRIIRIPSAAVDPDEYVRLMADRQTA